MAGAEAIDEKLAVKMVVLVLKRPGEQSIHLVLLFLSGKVIGCGDDRVRRVERGRRFRES